MEEALEKKADGLPDEGQQDAEEKTENKPQEKKDPSQVLREMCRGKLKLTYPIRARGQDVNEIRFDFCSLTGTEIMDALDGAAAANGLIGISNRQALAMFAATAEKCAPTVDDGGASTRLYDKKDIRDRISAADAITAVQLAMLFYSASSRAGSMNISKE